VVVMKSTIFWDITPCSPSKVNRRFGGTHRIFLEIRTISRAKYKRESRRQGELSAFHLVSRSNLSGHILRAWRWSRYILLKRRLTSNVLHGIVSQKMVLFNEIHFYVKYFCLSVLLCIENPTIQMVSP
jgi:hypothetical protein